MDENGFKVVLPGDELPLADFGEGGEYKIGPGLKIVNGSKIVSSRCGLICDSSKLYSDSPGTANWLDYRQKRYIPILNDFIVGQIVQKSADSYKLDFGYADLANLAALNFEGATKRNRPNVRIGDLIYGRICQTIEPEITCLGKSGVNRCLGILPEGGFLTRQNLNLVRKLLSPDTFPLLTELGKEVPFEICIGLNGWIWVKAHNIKETILVVKAIEMADHMTGDSVKPSIKRLVDDLRGLP